MRKRGLIVQWCFDGEVLTSAPLTWDSMEARRGQGPKRRTGGRRHGLDLPLQKCHQPRPQKPWRRRQVSAIEHGNKGALLLGTDLFPAAAALSAPALRRKPQDFPTLHPQGKLRLPGCAPQHHARGAGLYFASGEDAQLQHWGSVQHHLLSKCVAFGGCAVGAAWRSPCWGTTAAAQLLHQSGARLAEMGQDAHKAKAAVLKAAGAQIHLLAFLQSWNPFGSFLFFFFFCFLFLKFFFL